MSHNENEFDPVRFIVACVAFGVVMYPINYIESEALQWTLGAVAAAIAVFAYKHFGNYGKGVEEVASRAATQAKKVRESISSAVDDADLPHYEAAEKEVDTNQYDRGLWSQALVKCNGDESKRKITYIALRVAQMKRNTR